MPWVLALGYLAVDLVLVACLIGLLCGGRCPVPARLQWLFPVRSRWLYYFLVFLNVLAWLSLGVFFFLFARLLL